MRFTRGQYVFTTWDDGIGGTILFGIVEAAGPKMCLVRWESGIRSRLRQDTPVMKPVARSDLAEARRALLGPSRAPP